MSPTPASSANKPSATAVATIHDVAELAGVSVSTVSNVLNGRESRMREGTLLRVRQAISELGFRPNPSARQLKTGHMPMLGLLVPSIANPFFGTLARWVEAAALERGFGVVLCNTQRDPVRELAYAQALQAQGVRGVIIGSALQAQQHLEPMIASGMAVLGFDRTSESNSQPMDFVSMDNRRAGAVAAEHLISLGHRSLVYVTPALRSQNREARLAGVRAACEQAGVAFEAHVGLPQSAYEEGEMAEVGRAAVLERCRAGQTVSGWVGMNDMVALGMLAGLHESGLRVPTDVSLVGIDDLYLSRCLFPTLSTVRQPLREMAEAAVERVLTRMSELRARSHQLVFMPALVQRESSAPPPAVTAAAAVAATAVAAAPAPTRGAAAAKRQRR